MYIERVVISLCQNDSKEFCILVVRRGNVEKYVSNKFWSKRHINCTLKIEHARRFKDEEQAFEFWMNWKDYDDDLLTFIAIRKVRLTYQLI